MLVPWCKRLFLFAVGNILFAAASPVPVRSQDDQAQTPLASADLLRGLAVTPKAFRIAAAKVQPALVTIESFGGVSTIAGRIGGIRKQGEGNTSGIMISPDGHVITSSFNFIEQPPVITVITSDGIRRVAKLLGRDDMRRICLLKVEGVSDMPVPEMLDPKQVQVGQWAVSVGVGYGDKNPAVSMGIISAKNRFAGRAIQTDANISPANYGGPLIDVEGRVIGVCVPMSPGPSLASGVEWYDSGIGFAIPLAGAEALIERLKNGEHIQRAFMGIRSEDVGNKKGIRIVSVLDDTGAKKAGLQKDDVITAIDDQEIPDVAELRTVMGRHAAGDEIVVKITRDDDQIEVQVELGAPPKPDATDTPSLFPGRRRPLPGGKR